MHLRIFLILLLSPCFLFARREIRSKLISDTLCIVIFPEDLRDLPVSVQKVPWDSCLNHLFVLGLKENDFRAKFVLQFDRCNTTTFQEWSKSIKLYSTKMVISKVKERNQGFFRGNTVLVFFAQSQEMFIVKHAEATWGGAHPADK